MYQHLQQYCSDVARWIVTLNIKFSFHMQDWMVFYPAFNSISVISQRQLTLLMSFMSFTSTRLGFWSVLPKDNRTQIPKDPVRLDPGPLDYESNTLPLSHQPTCKKTLQKKWENAGYKHFLLFPLCFLKAVIVMGHTITLSAGAINPIKYKIVMYHYKWSCKKGNSSYDRLAEIRTFQNRGLEKICCVYWYK